LPWPPAFDHDPPK